VDIAGYFRKISGNQDLVDGDFRRAVPLNGRNQTPVQWHSARLMVPMKAYVVAEDGVHQWKARPGCRILVMDGGAVRFDFPGEWIACADSKYIRIIDRDPPDDRCGLIVSTSRISVGMTGIPVSHVLREATRDDTKERPILHRGPIISLFRPPLEAAWLQMRFRNRQQCRDACTRVCLARGGRTLATIVFDFWPEDELAVHFAWTALLETLAVGDYIEDPVTGRRREQRG
jgi:hypothetical protein